MSVRVTISDAELDVLYDLMDGDSPNVPGDARYDTLIGLIRRIALRDGRDIGSEEYIDAAVKRNESMERF